MPKGRSTFTCKIGGEQVTLSIPASRPKKGETPGEALQRRKAAAKKAYKASLA